MIGKQKRILVTWATGFIWSNIVRTLVSEWFTNIHIFSRKDSNYFRINDIRDKIHIHNVNFLDEVEINLNIEKIQPEIIFHLASAWTTVWKDPITLQELYNFNVLWTINLVNACKKQGFEYFINTGSSSEYGEKDIQMNENDKVEPNNDYGVTKASTTMYCEYIGKKNQLPIYTFRLFSVYGYYEEKRRLIPTLGLNFIQWTSPNLSNPDSVRDYIFIDDVVNCYLNVDKILWDFGGIYNIWSWNQYKISEVVANIKTILWSTIEPNYGVKRSAQFEPKTWVANNDKMINTFKQEPMTLFRWLEKTIKRLKINNHLYM